MKFLISLVCFTNYAFAQLTVSQYLQSRGDLSIAAASIAQNPDWSNPSLTNVALFVPLNSGNAANLNAGKARPGTLTVRQTINYMDEATFKYVTLQENNLRVNFDNYVTTNPLPTDVYIRYGAGTSRVREYYVATNGQVFIMDLAIPDDSSIMATLATKPQFSSVITLINTLGISAQINALRGVTFLAPSNSALAAFNAGTYTNQQLIAILQYHILSNIYTSERISPGPVASLLGPTVALGAGTGAITANTVGLWRLDNIEIADIFAVESVIQPLSAVLVPAGNALVPVAWPGLVAPVDTTTKQITTTTAANRATNPAATNGATGKAIPFILCSVIMMFLLL